MNIEQAIRDRRSIRGLQGPPLSPSEVEALVALALTAPAPHHTRPWRFVEVSAARRDALASAMGAAWDTDLERDGVERERRRRLIERSRRQIGEAPTLLLGCVVHEGLRRYPDERRRSAEQSMAAHSFGAAMQNILLAASAGGLGAHWISAPLYAPDAVRGALSLDQEWLPQALIALGRRRADYTPFDRPSPDVARHLLRR